MPPPARFKSSLVLSSINYLLVAVQYLASSCFNSISNRNGVVHVTQDNLCQVFFKDFFGSLYYLFNSLTIPR